MGKDPSMPLYVNDYLSSPRVQSMTEQQELAYFRLCLFCWASGDASLPDNDAQLMSMGRWKNGRSKGGSRVVENGWHVVRVCFQPHPSKPGFLTQEKVYRLWLERQEWREKSRIGGLNSAKKRGKTSRSKGGSRVVQPQGQPNGNPSSSSSSSLSSSFDSTSASAEGVVSSEVKGGGGAGGGGSRGDEIRSVFEHYRTYHPRAFRSPSSASKEWRSIAARLAEGYTVDDLKAAIDGNHRSPFHCGLNQRQQEYHNLDLIVRDGSHVRQFMEIPEAPPQVMSEREMRNQAAANQFIDEEF